MELEPRPAYAGEEMLFFVKLLHVKPIPVLITASDAEHSAAGHIG